MPRRSAFVLKVLIVAAVFPTARLNAQATLRQAAALHGIAVGTAVHSWLLGDSAYGSILASEFSQVEPENEMKFAVIHPLPDTYAFSGGDAIVEFARAHRMLVRGHTLVWHNQVPQWVTVYDSFRLANILQDHITTVMQRYAGEVYAWDVVNEAFNDDGTMRSTIWYDQPGIGFAGFGTKYIEQALRWAHAADPKAKLFYNDYDAEAINKKSDTIYDMARDFKARGVPLDGIGFQMHVTLGFENSDTLASFAANLQRFANLGLELHITELDIRLPDSTPKSLYAQAKLYSQIATVCVQQPACKVFQTWGFTDRYSWEPRLFNGTGWALLWDANYQKKPAYCGVLDALQ